MNLGIYCIASKILMCSILLISQTWCIELNDFGLNLLHIQSSDAHKTRIQNKYIYIENIYK